MVSAMAPPKYPVAKTNCTDRCGNISIPFPFGTREGCYKDFDYFVTCNHSFNTPKLFIQNTTMEITDITLHGQLRVLQFIARDCYARNQSISYADPTIQFAIFTVNNILNKFTIVGCDSYGFVSDIDECGDPMLHNCEKQCKNTPGGFRCVCPKGYDGDGRKGSQGCIHSQPFVYKLVAAIALGVTLVLVAGCWLYIVLKKRRLSKLKQQFFLQNGGLLLQEKLRTRQQISPNTITKSFSSSELERATKNFHSSMVIGEGGYGTVYKGISPSDHKIIVAVKKSKHVDPTEIEPFINEVIVLSPINHRNVVRLLGCCLETQVPLLVYEFISNGNLYQHIHNPVKARSLSLDMRLRIAAETAGVLSYLHSAASVPIIHRDVKSANILLDHDLTAKVSDFGASRFVPLDQTQLSTMVQGTFGYLDPEYMQTNQLTEKSDVYSFGVVLLELLTGRKALSFDRPEEEINLAYFFLSVLREERLFEILDENIVSEEDGERLMEAAKIADMCLKVRGEDRPSMKVVAMELEGLRRNRPLHPWAQSGQMSNADREDDDLESNLIDGNLDVFIDDRIGESSCISIGYDHSLLSRHQNE